MSPAKKPPSTGAKKPTTTTVKSGTAAKATTAAKPAAKVTPQAAKTAAPAAAAAPKAAAAAPAKGAAPKQAKAQPAAKQPAPAKPAAAAGKQPPAAKSQQQKAAPKAEAKKAQAPKAAAAAPAAAPAAPAAAAAAPKKPAAQAAPGAAKKAVAPKKAAQIQKKTQIRGVRKSTLKAKGQKKKKVSLKYVIDCTHPFEDKIMDVANFEKYLQERIKINGKTNNFGNNVTLERNKMKIILTSDIHFSKRSLPLSFQERLLKNLLKAYNKSVRTCSSARCAALQPFSAPILWSSRFQLASQVELRPADLGIPSAWSARLSLTDSGKGSSAQFWTIPARPEHVVHLLQPLPEE
ncbi:unnamed protein product [Nesidiocoris tenuis]|uniref:Large ribosomal subunit protein eL22 n=1 Tax=Nesidiocoris tenuis TaxID=355587 RepID=A0A6H5GJX0_9HEMI|nr:unnamed protein product [Nesidiocoris tenuis]